MEIAAGWLIEKGAASSMTDASPDANRVRIARREGRERAVEALGLHGFITPDDETVTPSGRQAPSLEQIGSDGTVVRATWDCARTSPSATLVPMKYAGEIK